MIVFLKSIVIQQNRRLQWCQPGMCTTRQHCLCVGWYAGCVQSEASRIDQHCDDLIMYAQTS